MAKDREYDNWSLTDLHAEATRREIEGRSQMDKPALVRALKDDDRAEAAPPPAAAAGARSPRDNRRILSGVQLVDGDNVVTHAGDTEEDHDALEAALSPKQYERLKAKGALEGDWHPKAPEPAAMANSLEDRSPEQAKRQREQREAAAKAKAKAAEKKAAKK